MGKDMLHTHTHTHTHTRQYHSAITCMDIEDMSITCMDIEDILLHEKSQRKTNATGSHLCV